MSPFEALFGRSPPSVRDYVFGQTTIIDLNNSLQNRQQVLSRLKENLKRSKLKMEQQANQKRKDQTFHIGDLVWLKLQPYRQQTVHSRVSPKLAKRYYGPFTILRRIGNVAYQLDLPPSSRIHPVIHVSQLRAYYGGNPTEHFRPIPPELEPEQGSDPTLPTIESSDQDNEQTRVSNEEEEDISRIGSEERQGVYAGKGKEKEDSSLGNSLDLPLDLPQTTLESITPYKPSDPFPSIQDHYTPLDPTATAGKESLEVVPAAPIINGPLNPNLVVKVFSEPDGSDRRPDPQRPKRNTTKPTWTKNYVLSIIGP